MVLMHQDASKKMVPLRRRRLFVFIGFLFFSLSLSGR
jgi:hypothetical protein